MAQKPSLQENILRIKHIPSEEEIREVRKELALNTEEGVKLWKEYEEAQEMFGTAVKEEEELKIRLNETEQRKFKLAYKRRKLYDNFCKLGRNLLEKELEKV